MHCVSLLDILFYIKTTALAFTTSRAGAVQQAEGFPGGGTGLQEAGFGPGLHGTTPGATRPAHSLKTAPALSL